MAARNISLCAFHLAALEPPPTGFSYAAEAFLGGALLGFDEVYVSESFSSD